MLSSSILIILIVGLSSLEANMIHNDLTCTICVDIVTDIDEFITDDTTEQQILDFFNQICTTLDQLIPGFGQTCSDFLYNRGPGIIESIVHENLNPTEICTNLGICP